MINTHRYLDHCAVIQPMRKGSVAQDLEHASHGLLGIILDVAHVGAHDLKAEVIAHTQQLVHALFIGRDLRAHVRDVLVRIACRPSARAQDGAGLLFTQHACAYQLEIGEQHTFLVDGV